MKSSWIPPADVELAWFTNSEDLDGLAQPFKDLRLVLAAALQALDKKREYLSCFGWKFARLSPRLVIAPSHPNDSAPRRDRVTTLRRRLSATSVLLFTGWRVGEECSPPLRNNCG